MLIQLPETGKNKLYFSFATRGTKLNFLREDLATNIIQYDTDVNSKRHMKIGKSSLHFQFKDDRFVDGPTHSIVTLMCTLHCSWGNWQWFLLWTPNHAEEEPHFQPEYLAWTELWANKGGHSLPAWPDPKTIMSQKEDAHFLPVKPQEGIMGHVIKVELWATTFLAPVTSKTDWLPIG